MNAAPFRYHETHGLERKPGNVVHRSSARLNWPNVFLTALTEQTVDDAFGAIRDDLLVIQLDRPTSASRTLAGKREHTLLQPGSVTIIPAGADFSVNRTGSNRSIHLYIRHDLITEVSGASAIELDSLLGAVDPFIYSIALEFCRTTMLTRVGCDDNLYIESLSRSLAFRLVRTHTIERHHLNDHARPNEVSFTLSQFDRAVDYIESCLDVSISLSSIATVVGVSINSLGLMFKENTGKSPHQYVMQRRASRAANLLRTTRMSFAEIAFQCGFSHQQHMNRIIRRLTGSTPGALRRGSAAS
jgi:AraC family transcriptional regulator